MSIEPYQPPRWLASGHAMTVFTWAVRRQFPRLPEPEVRFFDVGPDTRVMAKCHWQDPRRSRPTLVVLHGLEGSADSQYVRGIAEKAVTAGFNVVRLNQRGCGGTDHLSVASYHSGLTADPVAVIRELVERDRLERIGVVGYSLGGNLALKLAGEFGDTPPPPLKAVATVSPSLDLAVCAAAIERRSNYCYQRDFLASLKRRVGRKAAMFPQHFSTTCLSGVRTIREFDERYTARLHGFGTAANYYYQASALRVVRRIRVPTLIITAGDDPFVPVSQFDEPAVTSNPNIRLVVAPHGGHCGFYARRANDGEDRYWAERAVVDFVAGFMR